MRVAAWLLVAFALYVLFLVFELNGSQWDWWEGGSIACAGVALVLAAASVRRPRRVPRIPAIVPAAGLAVVLAYAWAATSPR